MTTMPLSLHTPSRPRPCPRALLAGPGRCYDLAKRSLDIVGAGIGLIIISPLLLGCMAWIWLKDGRPIFYKQWRVGQDGWLFQIYKLRTMTLDAERASGARWASMDDPRIIPGCAWMRKSHADELPQLLNILRGHMSFVGPRPERPELVEQLRPHVPNIEWRLAGRPGLTGLAQVTSGYANNVEGARQKFAHDLRYLRSRGMHAELRLLLRTIPKVWDRGAM